MTSLVWIRREMRLHDNPALFAATQRNAPCYALFVIDPHDHLGSSSTWWLQKTLQSFQKSIAALGGSLIICKGDYLTIIQRVAKECRADTLFYSKSYEPLMRSQEQALTQLPLTLQPHCSNLLNEPNAYDRHRKEPWKIFTPFWKAALKEGIHVKITPCVTKWPKSPPLSIKSHVFPLNSSRFDLYWQPSEETALARWKQFLHHSLSNYDRERDILSHEGTSRLSSAIHFGEISVRYMWQQLLEANHSYSREIFSTEIGWREFAHYTLFHFPQSIDHPLRTQFDHFPWRDSPSDFAAWTAGKTGYPIVDAGMRELKETGFMHNRARMIVASFLVKHLLLPWQKGAAWFFDTLLDADLANNTLGWQWSAGCGCDAAPYFRIFNPFLQAKKFDKNGEYVKRWVKEINSTKPHAIVGDAYPKPIVNHHEARERALAAFKIMNHSRVL